MAEITIDEVGLGTIAKYKLTAETSGVNLQSAKSWVFRVTGNNVTGDTGYVEIASGDDNVISQSDGSYIVYIDTSETGIGTLKGRVSMDIEDTDYIKPNSNEGDEDRNIRTEVSLAFDVLKVS